MRSMDLSQNGFVGTLPPEWVYNNLQYLNISLNSLVGTLPSNWSNNDALNNLSLEGNALSGMHATVWL